MKALLNGIHLNGKILGFHPQTRTLKRETKQYQEKVLLKRLHLNSHTTEFLQQTPKIDLQTK